MARDVATGAENNEACALTALNEWLTLFITPFRKGAFVTIVDPAVQRRFIITARQSRMPEPDAPSIVYLDTVDDLVVSNLANVLAVVCRQVTPNHHNEVICRTRGIPVIHEPWVDVREGTNGRLAYERAIPDALVLPPKKIQLSAFDPDQVVPTPTHPEATFFIRIEHQLLACTRPAESVDDTLERVKLRVRRFAAALSPGQKLLVRGLDVRTDDIALAKKFNPGMESNPELGVHGARHLLQSPDWVAAEAEVLDGLGSNVEYAVPFVTRHAEFAEFTSRYEPIFSGRKITAFAETPSIGSEIEKYEGTHVGLGLKDIAQFFFASDRGAAGGPQKLPLVTAPLPTFIERLVSDAQTWRVELAIHQTLESLDVYAPLLNSMAWVPSLTVPDYNLITRA